MNTFQKVGGLAAILHGTAYLVGIAWFVTTLLPFLNADPAPYMAFVADHQAIMRLGILIASWVPAASLVVLALAIHERLKSHAPALTPVATTFGLIWAALIIGSANLMLSDFGVVAELYSKSPAQAATVWTALQAVENGIVSGNELVGSLWVLLLSLAALRTGKLPSALNFLGIAISAAGILTLIPAIVPVFFGLGMIVWSIWVGIVLLRHEA